mgnify:FL=1
METSRKLEDYGVSAEIIYCHTLKPFDSKSVIDSVKKTKRIVAIEEHIKHGGLISRVMESIINLENIKFDFHCIPDKFIRNYGTYEEISFSLGFTAENILSKSLTILK